MTRSNVIVLAFAGWLFAFIASFYALGDRSDDIGAVPFLIWQIASGACAVTAWVASRRVRRGRLLRWMARVPGWISAILLTLFTAQLLFYFVVAG